MRSCSGDGTVLADARILVVDDEEIVALALKEVLTAAGHHTEAFTDPIPALEYINYHPVSVILTDQKMPGMTGLEFLAQATPLQPKASRILITGVLSLDTVVAAINKGEVYRFILKPWLREELLVTVQNAVQRYQLLCRNEALQARTQAMNRELQAQVSYIGEQNDQCIKFNQLLQENLSRSIELSVHMLEAFLPILGSQARRVHQLCNSMAEVLQLSADQREVLSISTQLCDIGLISAPRSLIRRWQLASTPLTEAEELIIRQHPVWGEELARFAHPLAEVATVIRAHHERFDGSGYPDQLEGEEIPWLARLLAVAVAFAESREGTAATVEKIRRGSGSGFDPEAVRAFVRALPKSTVPGKEQEVLLSELKPGMRLAKGIYTSTGVLLVPEGQSLTQTCIEKVLNHNRINPISQSLLIYC
jgi:response regulator RpfG family c-di-GMP phosphodiesterase